MDETFSIYLAILSGEKYVLKEGQQAFSVKVPDSKYFRYVGQTVSVTTPQLCLRA